MIAILRLIIIRIIRLLQVNVTRHHWLLVSALTSCSECLRTSYHWRPAQAPHHSDPAAASLAPGPRTSHLQAHLVGFKALHGLLPPYLADDCQLLADTGRRQLRSCVWRCDLFCPADSLVSRRSLFLWLDREHETVCLSNCDNRTSALNNLGGYLRRICLAKDYGA